MEEKERHTDEKDEDGEEKEEEWEKRKEKRRRAAGGRCVHVFEGHVVGGKA